MHAILTGVPGVGKTTIVKNICSRLKELDVEFSGFYTQEIRENGSRIGFQIVTTNNRTGTLSSVRLRSHSPYKVGQYGVEVDEFERTVMPIFENLNFMGNSVLIIDEIGKMEMFSDKFKEGVLNAFHNPKSIILATVPIAKGKPIPLVESIRSWPNSKLFTISKTNRNDIIDEIMQTINPQTRT